MSGNVKVGLILAGVAALVFAMAVPGTPELPTKPLPREDLVATISHGEEVDLNAHLRPGAWTLVEFYAEW